MNHRRKTVIIMCVCSFLLQCGHKSESGDSNPLAPSTTVVEQLYLKYQPSIFLAGVLISDGQSAPRYVIEIGTAFKTDGGFYYTNGHVALALHKLAGAFISDWVDRPFSTASLVLVPASDSLGHALPLNGFSLHSQYDTTLECPDIALLFLKSAPVNRGGIPVSPKNAVEALCVGQQVWTIGFPGETQYFNFVFPKPTLKLGFISALRPLRFPFYPSAPNQLIQYDLDLTGGTSGSPVFDMGGNLIGVNFSGYDQGSINFAVRSDLLFQTAVPTQLFAEVDTFRSHYEIIPGVSIGNLKLNSTVGPLDPNFSKSNNEKTYFTDSLTYIVQCLTASNGVKAMRLYEYNYDLFQPSFWTKNDLFIGANISKLSAAYTPSLLRVDHVDRGIDTVDISVVQSAGIAFVRDNNTIKEIYVFSPADTLDYNAFTYEEKYLAKTQGRWGGIQSIRVPDLFLR